MRSCFRNPGIFGGEFQLDNPGIEFFSGMGFSLKKPFLAETPWALPLVIDHENGHWGPRSPIP